jgi:hypothetical protein
MHTQQSVLHKGGIPTMVMGVDVNHAPPGAPAEVLSYAAIVATLDPLCTIFHTEASAHARCGS